MESFALKEYWMAREDQDSSFKLQLVLNFFEKYPYLIKNMGYYADIGCGNGSFILAFADYLKSIGMKYQIYGYDTSAYAIELAKKKDMEITLNFMLVPVLTCPKSWTFSFVWM
ncbi:MAG: class I SAM-dependent methyltransferase [Deltaproteobacteria bacterium]|nr:class I SAM-dependent methyltransferase [Deltaproteobacteria bacterium]